MLHNQIQGSSENLTEREAAEWLNVTVGTLQAWRYLRKGPPYAKLGGGIRGAVRYSLDDLRKFVEASKIIPQKPASPASSEITSMAALTVAARE